MKLVFTDSYRYLEAKGLCEGEVCRLKCYSITYDLTALAAVQIMSGIFRSGWSEDLWKYYQQLAGMGP